MAIKQDPNTILGTQSEPIASATEIALALANGSLYQYQTTKDVYVTSVTQRITNQQIFNNNSVNEVAGSTPGEIQFYSEGKFGSDKDFRYDPATDSLLVSGNFYAGKINLANADSLQIPGGMPGYVITTDGTGVLSWQPAPSTLPASNITFIPPAGMVSVEVQSAITELNAKKLSLSGGAMTGPLTSSSTITATGNITGGNLVTLGNADSGNVNTGNVYATGNVNATGGVFTYVKGEGGNLSNVTGANVVGNVASAITANFANFAGNVTVAAQPNITSVGTLISLSVTGNVDAANVNATGGSFTYVKGEGGNLSNITGANVSGQVPFAAVANSVAGANVSGQVANALIAGTVYTAAQPNITSVGTLTSLAVSGNANVGNIGGTNGVFTTIIGNLIGNVSGDGGNLSNLNGANVSGQVPFAAVANSVAGANVSGQVAFAAVANSVAGANVSGEVPFAAVANSVAGANVTGAVAFATTANSVAGANVTGTVASATVAASANSVAGANVSGEVAFAAVANSVAGANVTGAVAFATTANSVAGANVTGAVAFATTANSVAGANVSGQVANALVAGTVYTNAQPNITSVGTLTSLAVTGNVDAGNLTTGGNVVAVGNIQADTGFISNSLSTRTGPLTLTASGTSNLTLAVGTGNINLSTPAYITNVKDPVSAQDAATKNYVDLLAQGLKPKTSVQCATSASITLTAPGAAIDGHTLVSGDRVLVKNQATAAENGVYTYNGTGLVRATDSDTAAELADGVFVFVEFGSTYAASGFVQTAPVTTLGTDPVVFTQFSAGGSYTAGTGLTLTGSQFLISTTGVTAGSYGTARLVPSFTVDAQGQLTAALSTAVIANAETLDGATLKSTIVNSSLTSVGTLASLAVTGGVTAASFTGNHFGDAGNLANLRASNLVGTLSSLTVAGPINLGAVGNITITGGTSGQYLQTNGSGALTWATVAGGAGGDVAGPASSTDNAVVRYDLTTGKIIQNSVVIISDTGAVTGVSTLTTTGALTVGGVSTLGPVGNVTITGGTNGQVLTTNGSGVLAWSTVSAGGPASASSVTTVAAGNLAATNVQSALDELDSEKAAIASPTFTGVPGAPTAAVGTNTTQLATTAFVQAEIASVVPAASETVAGKIELATLAEVAAGTDTTRAVTAAGVKSVLDTKSSGAASSTDNAVVRFDGITGKIIQNGVVIISDTGDVTGVSALTVGGVSTLGPVGNVKITGGTNGQVLTTDGTGTLAWATVSGGGGGGDVVGPATAVTDNAIVRYDTTTGKLIQNSLVTISDVGAVSGVTDLTVSGTTNLNAVGNVTITGGTNGQVLTTNGSGVLSWATVAAGGPASASSVTTVAAGNLVATNVQAALNELDSEKAALASPTFTGVPAAPTATVGTNTTQLATTAFVRAEIASSVPAASETVSGKVELATVAEVATGTDTTRAVTAAGVKPLLDAKVTGAASSTDNAVARFDLATGKIIQNSVVIISDTGAVTGVTTLTASTSVQAPSLTTGAAATAGTITGTWTLTAGSTMNATYADLAERHHTDIEYPVGTVMTVGGVNEVTACDVSVTPIGVVSDQYAYLMNAEAGPDETHPAIGYLGRVPVRVIGPITKHQRIAPAGNGLAIAADKNSFGWALETNTEVGEKLVLCVIK